MKNVYHNPGVSFLLFKFTNHFISRTNMAHCVALNTCDINISQATDSFQYNFYFLDGILKYAKVYLVAYNETVTAHLLKLVQFFSLRSWFIAEEAGRIHLCS